MTARNCLLLFAMLLLAVTPAAADRPGWNEPPRAAGYDRNGLLQVNTAFFSLAAASGGDFYFWAPGEFATAAGLLKVPIASDPIAMAYGSGSGPFHQLLEVPVDGTVSRLSLFAGAQRLDTIHLLRPDGRDVEVNPVDVGVQTFQHMRIFSVEDPEPGLWRIELGGAGCFELAARYLTDRGRLTALEKEEIDLVGFTFVFRGGRPGHEGLFPLQAAPNAGTIQLCRINLSGATGLPTVDMVSASGEVLGTIRLRTPDDGGTAGEFFGNCPIPDRPFRVRVRGRDPEGRLWQRITAGLISPAAKHK